MTVKDHDVIPISRLFFDDDGPHIVRATTSPEDFGGTTLAPHDPRRVAGRLTPRAGTTVSGPARYTAARGRELQHLLGTSIAQLGAVAGGTRRTPPQPQPVAIETLLYRGRAALDRAREVAAAVRGTAQAPTTETIEELLDLIELAAED